MRLWGLPNLSKEGKGAAFEPTNSFDDIKVLQETLGDKYLGMATGVEVCHS